MKEYWVAKVDDIADGGCVTVQAGKRQISVFRIDGQFYAINNVCSHKGASICEGRIDKDRKVVRCPWHLWDWSLDDGKLEAYPNKRLPVFEVQVVDGEVLLYA